MKILYITSSLPNGTGEAFLIPEINEFLRQGHDLIIVPLYPRGPVIHEDVLPLLDCAMVENLFARRVLANALAEFIVHPGAAFRAVVGLRASRNRRILLRNLATVPKALWLARCARVARVDHVHAHWGACTATLGMLVSRLSGIPWSFTVHSWEIAEDNMLRAKAESAMFVRAISRFGQARLQSILGAAPQLIHLGVDIPERAVAPGDRSGTRFCICVIGSLLQVKGHRYLIEAWELLHTHGVDLDIEFVGDGPLREQLMDEVSRRGALNHVRFLGQVSHPQVLEMICSGRWALMVQPSIHADDNEEEGIPISVLEAMARGLPVIATTTGGIPEALGKGAGILVPPKDAKALAEAIHSVLLSPDLGRTKSIEGRKRAIAAFSVEETVRQVAAACGGELKDKVTETVARVPARAAGEPALTAASPVLAVRKP